MTLVSLFSSCSFCRKILYFNSWLVRSGISWQPSFAIMTDIVSDLFEQISILYKKIVWSNHQNSDDSTRWHIPLLRDINRKKSQLSIRRNDGWTLFNRHYMRLPGEFFYLYKLLRIVFCVRVLYCTVSDLVRHVWLGVVLIHQLGSISSSIFCSERCGCLLRTHPIHHFCSPFWAIVRMTFFSQGNALRRSSFLFFLAIHFRFQRLLAHAMILL